MKTTDLNNTVLGQYARARALHKMTVGMCERVASAARSLDGPAIIDAVYVLKRERELLEETRKEIDRCLKLAQQAGCMVSMHDPEGSLRGDIGQGYPNSGKELIVPDREKQPEQYAAVMTALGVTQETIDNPAIRPSWIAAGEMLTELAAEGKPVPPGLEHVKWLPKFTLVTRACAGVDLDYAADLVEHELLKLAGKPQVGPIGVGSPVGAEDIPF